MRDPGSSTKYPVANPHVGKFHVEVSRDYLIRAADLVFDGEQVPPQRGDVIRETSNGTTYVHEVIWH